eukprot:7336175-Pyramimonas_sp.AAC.1
MLGGGCLEEEEEEEEAEGWVRKVSSTKWHVACVVYTAVGCVSEDATTSSLVESRSRAARLLSRCD